jgi:hypothetical protein
VGKGAEAEAEITRQGEGAGSEKKARPQSGSQLIGKEK